MEVLKKSLVRKLLPQRSPHSHKGQNGKVLVIGGSIEFYGAPILAALGALNSGADLVTLLVPECNFDVSRSFYPDLIVRKYGGNHLNIRAFDIANPLVEHADTILIGPGLTQNEESLRTVMRLLDRLEKPAVIDADALPAITQLKPNQNRPLVITPHQTEFNELIEEKFDDELGQQEKEMLLQKYAKAWQTVILLKGSKDIIMSPFHADEKDAFAPLSVMNETGNAGMTTGGTGDVLAGITASFIAQGLTPFKASCLSAFVNGQAGDMLQKNKGVSYSATDVALELPYVINAL